MFEGNRRKEHGQLVMLSMPYVIERIARALPAFAVATIIFMLSAERELPAAAFSFPYADKLLHAGAYGVLALAIHIALPKGPERWRSFIAVAIASAYGLTDELHQRTVPGRSCDVWDWVADTAGAALAMLALRFWRGRTPPSAAVQRPGDAPDNGDRDIDDERPKRRHDQHAAEL